MDAAMLLLGIGQLALAVVLYHLLFHLRRDARRSSLAALLTVLGEMREKNARALQTIFTLISSNAFEQWNEQVRSGLMDAAQRLRAIQDAITEALLQTLRQCDSEWHLTGRLESAARSQVDVGVDRPWERWAAPEPLTPKPVAEKA